MLSVSIQRTLALKYSLGIQISAPSSCYIFSQDTSVPNSWQTKQSAYSLSERLSGHALALSNMCGLIHRRSWSISELVEVYDRSSDFKDGLETVWQLSFENLQPDCAALLSAFTFCAPDSIPHTLFEFNEETENLTDDMLWYLDSARLVVFMFCI